MEHLEQVLVDMKESLEREMRQGFARFDEVNARLDTQSARLERQGGLLHAGAR